MSLLDYLARKRFSRYSEIILFLADLLLLNLAYILSFLVRYQNLNRLSHKEAQTVYLLSLLIWAALVIYHNSYDILRTEPLEKTLTKVTRQLVIHLGFIMLFIVLLKYYDISRVRLMYFYGIFYFFIVLFRIIYIRQMKHARAKGYNYISVAFIGMTSSNFGIEKVLMSDITFGYKVVGYFDDQSSPQDVVNKPYKLIGTISDFITETTKYHIDEVYVCLLEHEKQYIHELIRVAERNMIRIHFVPYDPIYEELNQPVINYYNNVPVLSIRREPLENPVNRLMKRTFDLLFSSLVILFIFPWLFPLLAILIKLGSRGPVFFVQERSGELNESFRCLKFRTMRVNKLSDELQATANDTRITRIGKFLRKTNLDEFPQFFNVFAGQMSVVGPRPHMLKHTRDYSELINNFLVRHFAKPGITGWAQVNGYRGETKTVEDMRNRVEFDIWYIENWSFFLDLKIIWRTVFNMAKGEKNAY